MIINGRAITRRTILRGMGATLALPFLDSMLPAMSAFADAGKAPRRFSITYVAHGASPGYWIPSATGSNYELTKPLQPLAAFKDRMLVLTGLDNEVAMSR